jgi:enoyl reductase
VARTDEEALPVSLQVVAAPSRVATIAFNQAADRLGVRRLSTQRSQDRLTDLARLYSQGKLRIVHHAYPRAKAAEAHREVETGHVRGKIVLAIGDLELSG